MTQPPHPTEPTMNTPVSDAELDDILTRPGPLRIVVTYPGTWRTIVTLVRPLPLRTAIRKHYRQLRRVGATRDNARHEVVKAWF